MQLHYPLAERSFGPSIYFYCSILNSAEIFSTSSQCRNRSRLGFFSTPFFSEFTYYSWNLTLVGHVCRASNKNKIESGQSLPRKTVINRFYMSNKLPRALNSSCSVAIQDSKLMVVFGWHHIAV